MSFRGCRLTLFDFRIPSTAEATELKFSVPIDGPNENYATVGHMRVRVWGT